MNKAIRTLIFTLFGLTLLTAESPAADLLTNPGFESDAAGETNAALGWTAYSGNAFSETSATNAHSGTNFFKVYQSFTGGINYNGIYQDYISAPGALYSADGWAYTLAGDAIGGSNVAWLEVTFRDQNTKVLALYRSALIDANTLANGSFPVSTWNHLAITNQYDPNFYVITNTTSTLVAPSGTVFMRYQVVFQGDAANSGGSVYFDDLNLVQAGGAPYGAMNIVWDDEFNGTSINQNVWTFDIGNGSNNPGWGNSELEYYTSRTNNAYVANGCLHIVARQESTNGFSYTSARMKSQGLFSWTYGRFEWRAQLPSGLGCWPALWALGTNIAVTNIGWPKCGEIDVVENKGASNGFVQGSLHSGSDETGIYNFVGDSTTNFHIYTLDWLTNAFLFYVDGHLYETQTGWSTGTTNKYPFPFNQPFFLLMNLAIGGNYVGNPTIPQINAGTVFPAEMLVDYVRVYSPTAPLALALRQNGSNVTLTWPSNIICHLEAQTDLPGAGLGTNWITIPSTNGQAQVPSASGSAYYRLVSP